ncbi:MAG: M28 family peptidase [Bacteroidales bacterium]|jgi:hypothetical protein|nr:M28 family peptidase [Bacteroidales bacterium]
MRKLYFICCIIFICFSAGSQNKEAFYRLLTDINTDSLQKTIMEMQAFPSRFCLHNNTEVAEYIVNRLKYYGIDNAHIDSFYVDNEYSHLVGDFSAWMYNVKSTLTGTNDSTCIIGAHLDAVTYGENRVPYSYTLGANDNASGIAVMLEIARLFTTHQITPIKNIDFMAFDGEELFLWGARHDALNRKTQNQAITLMINNDMVAYQPHDAEWKLMLIEYENSINETRSASDACKSFTAITPIAINSWDIYSDSYAYYNEGYKAIFVYEYYDDPNYHSVTDVYENLNYAYLKEVVKLNISLLYHYAIDNVFQFDTTLSVLDWAQSFSDISLFPNPTQNTSLLKFYLPRDEDIGIIISDVSGKIVLQYPFQRFTFGTHQVLIESNHLTSGLYFCTLQTLHGRKTIKWIVDTSY